MYKVISGLFEKVITESMQNEDLVVIYTWGEFAYIEGIIYAMDQDREWLTIKCMHPNGKFTVSKTVQIKHITHIDKYNDDEFITGVIKEIKERVIVEHSKRNKSNSKLGHEKQVGNKS